MDDRVQAAINYFARENHSNVIFNVCSDALVARPHDPLLRFWRAFALVRQGNTNDALRELEPLQSIPDVSIAATAAAIAAHEMGSVRDEEAIMELETRLEIEESGATDRPAINAATFYWHNGATERARAMVERALSLGNYNRQASTLMAWVLLSQHKADLELGLAEESDVEEALSLFQRVLQEAPADLEALLGKAEARGRSTFAAKTLLREESAAQRGGEQGVDVGEGGRRVGAVRHGNGEGKHEGVWEWGEQVLRWQGRLNEALDALALAHVKHPWFLPVLAEKAKLMMMRNEWERIMEGVIHVGSVDETNPTAAGVAPQMSAFAAINSQVREGNSGAAAKHAKDILSGLDAQEPRNAVLFLSYSRLLARIACGDRAILEQSLALAQRAVRCGQGHPQYGLELALQHNMTGQLASARQALLAGQEVAGELQMAFALALIECQLQSGEEQDVEAAASALEVYSEMSSSASEAERAWLAFLQALLAQRKQLPPDSASKLFEVATRLQLALINDQPVDFSFFVQLNPSRVVQLLSMMLDLAGNEPRGATEAASPLIGKAMTALSILHRHCPGLLAAQLLTARAHYLSADFEPAMRVLSDIVHSSDNVCEAHLLMASIYLHQDRPELAQQALDQAMSASFEVRDSAAFHALLGQTQLAKGRPEEAKQTLERAMALPGVRTALPAEQQSFSGSWKQPNLQQRAAIYLQLAQAEQQLSHLEEAPEAAKLLKEAEALFQGTSEEVKVLIANCELAISGKHDVEGALKRLRKIKPDSPFFTKGALVKTAARDGFVSQTMGVVHKVRVAMANIYLKHRNDKRAYAACYADLADNFPSFETFCMLGEAFLQIQEPAKAVEAFDAARERGAGRESALLSKIGKALIATHEYSRAVDYYAKAIVNNPSSLDLQLDLAELHLRLRQWPRALERLQKCLQQLQHDNALSMGQLARLKMEVQILLSMAKVSQAQELPEKRLELLQAAAQKQRAILPHMSGEGPDAILEQKERTAAICYSIGDHHRKLGRLEEAMAAFKQAIQICEDHAQSMLALARVYLVGGDLDNCQDMCATLQRIDPSNEEAAMMLSELMFHREHFESAIYHSEQLLERTPANWRALAHLVQQLRRAGRLKDAPECLERTRAKVPTAAQSPGFSFCVGLHQRFCNEPQEALQAFNHARADPDFQVEAVYNMVEIYINPDNDAVWQETKESEMDELQNEEARLAARKLLDSIRRQAGGQVRFQVLECYAQMSSRQPADAEAAVSKLLDLASADPNAIPVLLALSTGFMLLNQTPKARNQLKRMQKMTMKPEHAEELERAWLLLAELFVQGGKYDLAQDLCTRCLKYNQSCAKAWEMQGQIWEKEQAYKDAADAYEKAWELENHAQAGVGYKLAFNYLKAQRFVEAIDISRAVLKQFPDYPKIGSEVLQKAQASIRV